MNIHEIIYVRRRVRRSDDGVKRGQTLSKSNSFRLWERLSAYERVHVLGVNAKHETHAKRRVSCGDERVDALAAAMSARCERAISPQRKALSLTLIYDSK